MTKREFEIVRVGIFITILSIIFPPWKVVIGWENNGIEYSKSIGFHPIFFPPTEDRFERVFQGSTIDVPRLLMIWVAIGLITGYSIIAPRFTKDDDKEKEIEERKE